MTGRVEAYKLEIKVSYISALSCHLRSKRKNLYKKKNTDDR